MMRTTILRLATAGFAIALAAQPALAQQAPAQPAPAQPAPAQGQAPAQPQGGRDVPMARLLSDGAQVRGIDSKDRLVLQFGRFLFLCHPVEGRPHLCDQML